MKVTVTGASGLIGTPLVAALRAAGHDVVRLVRHPPAGPDERQWDPASRALDPAVLADSDAVVHLAGAGVADKRWTAAYKDQIVRSRLDGTTTIAQAMAAAGGPKVLLSASAIGWYGDTGDRLTSETGPAGEGFLADVCRQWEAATAPAGQAGVRVAHLRTGIVLAREGGALPLQRKVFLAGLGAPLGTGRQYVSWVSLHDEVAAIVHLLTADVEGPVNLVGPEPVTNRAFTKTLGRALHRPTWPIAVPGFALRVVLGPFADEGVLIGQRLVPGVLAATGFMFTHTELAAALHAAV